MPTATTDTRSRDAETWKVLRHGPIERFAENLWWVQGRLPRISLKRTMTVARRSDGRLVIYNAIALEETAMREIEAWGEPAFMIVPNGYHRLDAPAFKQRYPKLVVLAPRGSRRRVEQVVPVSGTFEDYPSDPDVQLEMLNGVRAVEGAMIVRSADGRSVVLNDVVFNMDVPPGLFGFLFARLNDAAPGPRVTRLAKLTLVKDRGALRADLERLAELPDLQRLIVAHEDVAHGAAARAALLAAASRL